MIINTSGLVVREQKVNDSDCVITVMTDKLGVIRVWANGIYSPKSKNRAARLFCYSDFTLFKNKEKYTLNNADGRELFFNLRKDIADISLCSYFAQLAATMLDEGDDASQVLPLTLNSFFLISEGKTERRMIKACYELRFASLIGYAPTVGACSLCGGAGEFFDVRSGHTICFLCKNKRTGQLSLAVGGAVVKAVEHIVNTIPDRIFSFKISDENIAVLAEVAERFLLEQCGRGFPALDFYKGL